MSIILHSVQKYWLVQKGYYSLENLERAVRNLEMHTAFLQRAWCIFYSFTGRLHLLQGYPARTHYQLQADGQSAKKTDTQRTV